MLHQNFFYNLEDVSYHCLQHQSQAPIFFYCFSIRAMHQEEDKTKFINFGSFSTKHRR